MKKCHREAIDLLRELGAEDISIEHGKHLKLRYTFRGRQHLQVTGATPSDVRWRHKFTKDFRKVTQREPVAA